MCIYYIYIYYILYIFIPTVTAQWRITTGRASPSRSPLQPTTRSPPARQLHLLRRQLLRHGSTQSSLRLLCLTAPATRPQQQWPAHSPFEHLISPSSKAGQKGVAPSGPSLLLGLATSLPSLRRQPPGLPPPTQVPGRLPLTGRTDTSSGESLSGSTSTATALTKMTSRFLTPSKPGRHPMGCVRAAI